MKNGKILGKTSCYQSCTRKKSRLKIHGIPYSNITQSWSEGMP
jgi:hypothetical protein